MNVGTWHLRQITPEAAEQMLSAMGANRNLNPRRVALYADAMKKGEWTLTHQGLAITDGKLTDGQHRCMAVVTSNVPVVMWVYETSGGGFQHNVDRHRPRTDADIVHISGHTLTTQEVAWVRVIAEGLASFGSHSTVMQPVEVVGRAEKIAWVVDTLRRVGLATKSKGLTHACSVGAIGRMYMLMRAHDSTRAESFLREFVEVYSTGECADRSKLAALRLREFYRESNARSGGAQARREFYLKSCSAVIAFIERRPLAQLRTASADGDPIAKWIEANYP